MPTQPSVAGLGQFPAVTSLSILNGANGFELDGVAGDSSGKSVSTAGDINNDGIIDMIIGGYYGSSNVNPTNAGRTYIVFGKASGWTSPISLSTINGTNGFVLNGVANETSGASVSTAGDVNNDGIADIIIGAQDPNSIDTTYSITSGIGRAYVVFGKANGWTSPISLSTINGTNGFVLNGEQSGSTVSAAGDVNNDGIDDIIIGATGDNRFLNGTGKTYVVFGKASGWISPISLSTLNGANGFALEGESPFDRSGRSVRAAGDVNNDGISDIIIGAHEINGAAGKTYVVFGKASGWTSPISLSMLNGANGFTLTGEFANDQSGYSVSTAGDINNDGISDIIIGAPRAIDHAGKTYVLFGKASTWSSPISLGTLDGTNGFILEGLGSEKSGYSVSTAGDVNNDGIDDIIIGAIEASCSAGKVYVVFGKASGWVSPIPLSTLNGANGFELDGVSVDDVSGYFVNTAGDVNNDGVNDIIIGALGANTLAGKTYVVFGDSPPVLANNTLTVGAGCIVTLDSSYLAAYDLNNDNSTLTFTASNVTNGNFQKNVLGLVTPLITPAFLQSDITAGYIQFVSTNSNAPSYSMMVSSPGLAFVPATPAVVSFTAFSCSSGVPTEAPSLAPNTQVSTQAPSLNGATPTLMPSFAPSVALAVSSATRTNPVWLLPISETAALLNIGLPAAYQSVSDYLSGSDASSKSVDNIYGMYSLEAAGAQLMLGAVALKLVQKGVNWAKGFLASKPPRPDTKPVLSEVTESLQMLKDSDTVSASVTKNLTAEMKHLSEKMETYQACLEETSAQSDNVVYPDFQKSGLNFAYNAVAGKRRPSIVEEATVTKIRLATVAH